MRAAATLHAATLAVLAATLAVLAAAPRLARAVPVPRDVSERVVLAQANADSPWLAGLIAQVAKKRYAFRYPERYRAQVLVGLVQGTRDSARLVQHSWRVGAERVYPASAFKPLVALAALDAVRVLQGELGEPTGPQTTVRIAPLGAGENEPMTSVEALARDCLVWSDNRATNRLYDVAGHARLHALAGAAGLRQTRIVHRMGDFRPLEDQRRSPPMRYCGPTRCQTRGALEGNAALPTLASPPRPGLGERHIDPLTGELRDAPFDLRTRNRMPLVDLQRMMVAITRPELLPPAERFAVHPADLRLIKQLLAERGDRGPARRKDERGRVERWDPLRFKPVLRGLKRAGYIGRWRVWSKAGRAYGFRVENAYVEDTKSGRAFFIAITVHADPDGTVNDNQYATERIADRFIRDVVAGVAHTVSKGLAPRP